MVTIRMEYRGRVYYFKAENKNDAEIMIVALQFQYPGSRVNLH